MSSTNDIGKIREMSGVCPQHDVLYDNLNSVEHLEIYASLKNVPRNQIDSQVSKYKV